MLEPCCAGVGSFSASWLRSRSLGHPGSTATPVSGFPGRAASPALGGRRPLAAHRTLDLPQAGHDPPRRRRKHRRGELGEAGEQGAELAPGEHGDVEVRGGDDRCRAVWVADERDLAEEVARAEIGNGGPSRITSTIPSMMTKNSWAIDPCRVRTRPAGTVMRSARCATSTRCARGTSRNTGSAAISLVVIGTPSGSTSRNGWSSGYEGRLCAP